jgi:hypothetical protein
MLHGGIQSQSAVLRKACRNRRRKSLSVARASVFQANPSRFVLTGRVRATKLQISANSALRRHRADAEQSGHSALKRDSSSSGVHR